MGWKVIPVRDVGSVEVGLSRERSFADELVSTKDRPVFYVWRSQPAVLVTRSETRLPHFDAAKVELCAAG